MPLHTVFRVLFLFEPLAGEFQGAAILRNGAYNVLRNSRRNPRLNLHGYYDLTVWEAGHVLNNLIRNRSDIPANPRGIDRHATEKMSRRVGGSQCWATLT